jgi:hypothetical protein
MCFGHVDFRQCKNFPYNWFRDLMVNAVLDVEVLVDPFLF